LGKSASNAERRNGRQKQRRGQRNGQGEEGEQQQENKPLRAAGCLRCSSFRRCGVCPLHATIEQLGCWFLTFRYKVCFLSASSTRISEVVRYVAQEKLLVE
jgi:hypothetical protein